jgi:hypothetical protein
VSSPAQSRSRLDQSSHAVEETAAEETAAPVQENHGRMPTIAGRPQQIAVEHRRGLPWAVIVGRGEMHQLLRRGNAAPQEEAGCHEKPCGEIDLSSGAFSGQSGAPGRARFSFATKLASRPVAGRSPCSCTALAGHAG